MCGKVFPTVGHPPGNISIQVQDSGTYPINPSIIWAQGNGYLTQNNGLDVRSGNATFINVTLDEQTNVFVS